MMPIMICRPLTMIPRAAFLLLSKLQSKPTIVPTAAYDIPQCPSGQSCNGPSVKLTSFRGPALGNESAVDKACLQGRSFWAPTTTRLKCRCAQLFITRSQRNE